MNAEHGVAPSTVQPTAYSTTADATRTSDAVSRVVSDFTAGRKTEFDASATPREVIPASLIQTLLVEAAGKPKELHITGARIVGDLHLTGISGVPLFALKDCDWADGTLYLNFAKLRSFFLDGTRVKYIDATRCEIEGTAYLRDGFAASAGINFSGAWIRGTLSLRGATLGMGYEVEGTDKREPATLAEHVNESAYALRLVDARIAGRLMLANPRLLKDERKQAMFLGSVELRGCEATEFLDHRVNYQHIERVVGASKGEVALPAERDGVTVPAAVLAASRLHLEGFTYTRLSVESEADGAYRCEWLRSFRPESDETELLRFRTHSYSQLARSLHDLGWEHEARKVLVERHRREFLSNEKRRNKWFAPVRRAWNWASHLFAGYGFYPGRLHGLAFGVVLLYAIMLRSAWMAGVLVPSVPEVRQTEWWRSCAPRAALAVTRAMVLSRAPSDVESCLAANDSLADASPDYPRFRPAMYTLDAFLPIVDLHQEQFWSPAERLGEGRRLSWFLILLRAAGWFYVSFAIAALFQSLTKRGAS